MFRGYKSNVVFIKIYIFTTICVKPLKELSIYLHYLYTGIVNNIKLVYACFAFVGCRLIRYRDGVQACYRLSGKFSLRR